MPYKKKRLTTWAANPANAIDKQIPDTQPLIGCSLRMRQAQLKYECLLKHSLSAQDHMATRWMT